MSEFSRQPRNQVASAFYASMLLYGGIELVVESQFEWTGFALVALSLVCWSLRRAA